MNKLVLMNIVLLPVVAYAAANGSSPVLPQMNQTNTSVPTKEPESQLNEILDEFMESAGTSVKSSVKQAKESLPGTSLRDQIMGMRPPMPFSIRPYSWASIIPFTGPFGGFFPLMTSPVNPLLEALPETMPQKSAIPLHPQKISKRVPREFDYSTGQSLSPLQTHCVLMTIIVLRVFCF